jgi:hypothetical protein
MTRELVERRQTMMNEGESAALSRRDIVSTLLGAVGGAAIAGCNATIEPTEPVSVATAALTGTALRWADTVLGASPPATRTGDLATKNSSAIGGAVLVLAKGCVTAGDGGGGLFYWESGVTTGDDGGTIIVPTPSPAGRWRRICSGPLDVRWFGAQGNGSTDDSVAFTKAAAAAGSAGCILLSGGTYKLAQPLTLSCGVAFAHGAKLAPTTGTTLAIGGSLLASQGAQIFVVPAPPTSIALSILSSPVDVRWFGAKGDGITDCSPAINAAIDSMTGGELLFPPGQYRFTQTIRNGNKVISFVGGGFQSLLLFDPPSGHYGDDAVVLTGFDVNVACPTPPPVTGMGTCVRNLRLESKHNNTNDGARLFGCGITLLGALFTTLENVWVRYFDARGGRGISLQDAWASCGGGAPPQDTTTYGVVIQGCDIGMEVLAGGPTSNHSLSINQCNAIGLHLVNSGHFHWYGGLAQCTTTSATILFEPNSAGGVSNAWFSGIHFEGGNGSLVKALPFVGAAGVVGLNFKSCNLSYTGSQPAIDLNGVVNFVFECLILYSPLKLRNCAGRLASTVGRGVPLDVDGSNFLEWVGWDASTSTLGYAIGTTALARAGVALDLATPLALPEYPAGNEPSPAVKNMVIVNSTTGRLRLCTVGGSPGTWVDM